MGDWSAVRPARCQTLFRRGRQQRAFGRSSEDSVEIVYHVGLIGKAASMGNIGPSQSLSPLDQDLFDSCTTRKLLGVTPNTLRNLRNSCRSLASRSAASR